MSTLLKIDVSPRGAHSISRKLGNHFATEWQSNHVGGKIVTRDLATTKIPFVDLPWIAGAFSAPDAHTAEHKACPQALRRAHRRVAGRRRNRHLHSDVQLQCSRCSQGLDRPHRPAEQDLLLRSEGLKGLAVGKKLTILVASGSEYTSGSPMESYNLEVPYFHVVFGFIGITDITIVHAGGTNKVARAKSPSLSSSSPSFTRSTSQHPSNSLRNAGAKRRTAITSPPFCSKGHTKFCLQTTSPTRVLPLN